MSTPDSPDRAHAARSKLEVLYAAVVGDVDQLVGRIEAAEKSLASSEDEARRVASAIHENAVELRNMLSHARTQAARDREGMQQALMGTLSAAAKRQPVNVRQLLGVLLVSFIGSVGGVMAAAAFLLSR